MGRRLTIRPDWLRCFRQSAAVFGLPGIALLVASLSRQAQAYRTDLRYWGMVFVCACFLLPLLGRRRLRVDATAERVICRAPTMPVDVARADIAKLEVGKRGVLLLDAEEHVIGVLERGLWSGEQIQRLAAVLDVQIEPTVSGVPIRHRRRLAASDSGWRIGKTDLSMLLQGAAGLAVAIGLPIYAGLSPARAIGTALAAIAVGSIAYEPTSSRRRWLWFALFFPGVVVALLVSWLAMLPWVAGYAVSTAVRVLGAAPLWRRIRAG